MPAAARNYDAYLEGEYAWALGRFIVPAARLGEADTSWKVSVIGVPPRWVESCEIKIDHAPQAAAVLAGAPQGVVTYFEVPINEDPKPLSAMGVRAKIRTGGLSPKPSPPVPTWRTSCIAAPRPTCRSKPPPACTIRCAPCAR